MPSVTGQHRRDRRDPRLPLADLFDAAVAQHLWDQLPPECRRDHFDKSTMPAMYRNVVVEHPSGITAAMKESGTPPSWTTCALNLRGLPQAMIQELAWLVHREAELGLRIYPMQLQPRRRRSSRRNPAGRYRSAVCCLAVAAHPGGVGPPC